MLILLSLSDISVCAVSPVDISQTVVSGVLGQTGVIAEDFDGDGTLDLLSGNEFDGLIYFWHGTTKGEAVFASPWTLATSDGKPIQAGSRASLVAALDLNGDGLKDLVLAERRNLGGYAASPYIRSYTNVGTASSPVFQEEGWLRMRSSILIVPEGIQGIRAADWNGDGRQDLLAGCVNAIWIALNEGPQSAVTFGPWQRVRTEEGNQLSFPLGWLNLDFGDWDLDGRPDLIVGVEYLVNQQDYCAGARGLVYVYRNAGSRADPRFSRGFVVHLDSGTPLDVLGCVPSPSLADWNCDGSPDLILGASEACGGRFGGVFLFCQNTGPRGEPLLSGVSFYDYGPWRIGENCSR